MKNKYLREDLKCLPEDCINCHDVMCEFYQGIREKEEYVRKDLKCRPEDCKDCHNTCCSIHQGFPGEFDD